MIYLKNLIRKSHCDEIFTFLKENTSKTYEAANTRPWFENNNIFYTQVRDPYIKDLLRNYIFKLSIEISLHYKKKIYPHYTDLVLWNKGKSMEAHVDTGKGSDEETRKILKPRHYSSVIYLNDDFKGGQTFVKQKKVKPQKGAALIFESNVPHGVAEVKEGVRGTIASWFTRDFQFFDL